MTLTIGSLFSGVGGFELGLEQAGLGPVLWQCEINKFCGYVLEKHWPCVTRYPDVRLVGNGHVTRELLGHEYTIERTPPHYVDVVCGGFPCQDVSLAGLGAGLAGARSGLWREYLRIVGDVRPRFVAIENVPALASRGLVVVLGDLAALGYDAIWFPLSAQDVGAPHKRERIFVVAWRVSDADRESLRHLEQWDARRLDGIRDERLPVAGHMGEELANGDSERPQGKPSSRLHEDRTQRDDAARRRHRAWPPKSDDVDGWRAWIEHGGPQPCVCGSTSRLPFRLDQLEALGNAVLPPVAEVVGQVILQLEAMGVAA